MNDSVELLCIGTEILLGDILNTNSQAISRGLAGVGMNLYHHTVVGDNPKRLLDALNAAFSRNNIVITTGGLGPTYDDLTKETIAGWFDLPLEMHEPSKQGLIDFFERLNRPMTENNLKQAMMPKGCIVLENPNGTAPGAIIQGKDKVAIMMPGPPREMEPMFENQVLPWLQKRSGKLLRSHSIHFFGIGESQLESELREMMQGMENPTLAPYAKEGEVLLRITAAAQTEQQAEDLMQPVIERLKARYQELIYGVDVHNLQTAAVQALQKEGLTVATAESCTGGYISKRLTEVAGSSEVFGCGVVSYANETKENLLGVSHRTLQTVGAVSPETARQMADGVRRISGADIGISTTGIAGPGGATPQKPVGLVYLGVSSAWRNEVLELRLAHGYQNERELIRYVAASHALSQIIKTVAAKG